MCSAAKYTIFVLPIIVLPGADISTYYYVPGTQTKAKDTQVPGTYFLVTKSKHFFKIN